MVVVIIVTWGDFTNFCPMSSWTRLRGVSSETSIIHSVYIVAYSLRLLTEINEQ